MSVKSGQVVTVDFVTADPTTGAATDADSTPVGTLVINGTDGAATVTVTNKATGVYKAAVTLPTLSAGDVVSIRVAATVATVAGVGVAWTDVADTKRVSDLKDEAMRGTDSAMLAASYTAPDNAGITADKTAAEAAQAAAEAVVPPGTTCVLTSDKLGQIRVGSPKISDSLGGVTWRGLAGGAYYIWRDHPSYSFGDPVEVTVE